MKKVISCLLWLCPLLSVAQVYRVPLEEGWKREARYFQDTAQLINPSIYPIYLSKQSFLKFEHNRIKNLSRNSKKKWLGRKLFDEHTMSFSGEDFYIAIDPVLNFQGGRDLEVDSVRNLSTNQRGLQVYGNIGKKISFYTSFSENQSFFPKYLTDYNRDKTVVPGLGAFKGFKEKGFDYNNAFGQVMLEANKNITFVFGHDKLFVGPGYRSVLLSDGTFNYPQFSAKANFFKKKLHYQITYAWLQEKKRVPRLTNAEATYIRKDATFHLLSFLPVAGIEIGLFNGTMWKRWNDSMGSVDPASGYYIPIAGLSQLISNQDDYYTIYGGQLIVRPWNGGRLYGQYAADQNGESSWQAGVEWNGVFSVKNLFVQAEHNSQSSEMYQSKQPYTSYSNFGEGLGMIHESRISESIVKAGYAYKSFFINLKLNSYQRDQAENITIYSGDVGYLLNPNMNLQLYVGVLNRVEGGFETNWIRAGLRTQLSNFYDDF